MAIKREGFTYIELLITLTLIGIIFLSIMQFFSHSLYSVNHTRERITALNLAKWQMEKIKNLNLSKREWLEKGSSVYPSVKEEPLFINQALWRIYTEVKKREGPLEILVKVKKEGEDKPLITLYTLTEDSLWKVIKPN
jgi:prepilin-type N-terminal cleavage/methylation domain-containing protein